MFTKWFPTPCYAPDDAGQGGDEPPVETPEDGQGTPETFWTSPEGTNFASPDELAQAWKDGVLMRSDYTQKTQAHAKERKEFERQREDFQREYDRFREEQKRKEDEFKQFDRLVRERPDVYNEMKKRLQSPLDGNATAQLVEQMLEEKLGPELKELRQFKEQQETEKELEKVYGELGEKYPDFDKGIVDPVLNELSEGGFASLAELIYHANRGRSMSPAEVERRVAENLEKKKNAGLASGKSGASTGSSKAYASIEDVANSLQMES